MPANSGADHDSASDPRPALAARLRTAPGGASSVTVNVVCVPSLAVTTTARLRAAFGSRLSGAEGVAAVAGLPFTVTFAAASAAVTVYRTAVAARGSRPTSVADTTSWAV